MALIVPRAYLGKYEEIKNKDSFYQISLLLWFDSVPSDWIERVSSLGHPCLVSPRHDKDILEDGSAKKPHYHLLFLFNGRKTGKECQYIADYVSDQMDYSWLYVADRQVMARYECHLDSPKKHRYPVSELLSINGAPIEKLIAKAADEDDYVDETLNDIFNYISNTHCIYFNQLIDFARDNDKGSWIRRLRKDLTPIVKAYMAGLRLESEDNYKRSRRL